MKLARVLMGGLLLAGMLAYGQSKGDSIAANKRVVEGFYLNIWEPRNLAAWNDWCSPNYIEHNPNFPGRADNILKMLRSRDEWNHPDKIGKTLKDPPSIVVAEGDIVQWIWQRKAKDPNDPSKTYEYSAYDTFRVKDGKIVEHWDAARIAPRQK